MAAVPNFQAILAASLAADGALRAQAEQAVAQLSVADPPTFFLELSKELRNDALEDRLRQQAGLIMKIHLDATVRFCAARRRRARARLAAPARARARERAA